MRIQELLTHCGRGENIGSPVPRQNIASVVSVSDKCRITLTLIQERDKLLSQAVEIEVRQRKLHSEYVLAMKALSRQHEAVLNKMIVIEEVLK